MRASPNTPSHSRREFLQVSALALAGMFLPTRRYQSVSAADQQGRVIDNYITVYDRPSFQGERVKIYWKDTVLPLTEATIGDAEPKHNRVWYRIGSEGYAHSGSIQPVRTRLQTPANEIPKGGILAEVTVPYTDAHWGPSKSEEVAYRFYYETTHWVTDVLTDSARNTWYQVIDDKWEFLYYAPAAHLRLIPPEELTPLSPDIPAWAKRLEVRTWAQVVVAFEFNRPVFMARTATGAKFSDGNFSTPPGRHFTFHKRPSRHMAAGNLAANGYDLPGVPWVCYITEEGVAFHGTYWHNDFGKPRSHGCINLTPQAAKWIYRWTLPVVPPQEIRVYDDTGTTVDVI